MIESQKPMEDKISRGRGWSRVSKMTVRLSRMRMQYWFWASAKKKSLETLVRVVSVECNGWKPD